MRGYDGLNDVTAVPAMLRGDQDDVLDHFLDMISIYAAGSDLFVVAAAAYTELKPYISLAIELDDPSEEKEIASDFSAINDATLLRHTSRFENLGEQYAGKKVHIELTACWINPDGSKNTTSQNMDASVDLFSALEKLEVNKPRASDGKRTDVLYGTYTAGRVYDYRYLDNNRYNAKVKAMLPLDGCLELGREWRPREIDYSEGNRPKLYMLLSSGGAVAYSRGFDPVFTLTDHQVNFRLPDDDWGAYIDVSRLGSSTMLDLYFSFTVKLTNDYYPTQKYTARATVICRQAAEEDPMVKVAVIEPIYLYWDCLSENMTVQMYPDGEKPIAQLKAGDQVMDAQGMCRTVAVCAPARSDEIIQVRTDQGTVLEATRNHVVKTNTGFARVGDLTNCGYLLTKRGPAGEEVLEGISSIKECAYEGLVYHVELEDGNTFMANHVISGDGRIEDRKMAKWPDDIIRSRELLHLKLSELNKSCHK